MPHQARVAARVVTADAGAALKVLKTSIDKGSPDEIKRCLIAWGDAYYPENKILSLTQLSQCVGDTAFENLVFKLEQALYSEQQADAFDRNTLFQLVSDINKKGSKSKSSKKDYSLPPLYKN